MHLAFALTPADAGHVTAALTYVVIGVGILCGILLGWLLSRISGGKRGSRR